MREFEPLSVVDMGPGAISKSGRNRSLFSKVGHKAEIWSNRQIPMSGNYRLGQFAQRTECVATGSEQSFAAFATNVRYGFDADDPGKLSLSVDLSPLKQVLGHDADAAFYGLARVEDQILAEALADDLDADG